MALSKDGRYSYARLAKELGINVLTLTKRVTAMLEAGVVSIRAIPNPVVMGYSANAVINIDADLTKIDSLCARLVKNPYISLVITTFGRFDVLLMANFSSWEMLQDFVKDDLVKIEGVNQVDTLLVSEVKKKYQGMFPSNANQGKHISIDEIDHNLIEELSINGRSSYADLGKKYEINSSTVSRRVASLIKRGVIKIVAVPYLPKLGYSASAYVVLHVNLSEVDNICTQLSGFPEVHLIMKLMNDFDIVIGLFSPNHETLYDLLTKIAGIPGVLNMESFIRAGVKKASYIAPLLLDNKFVRSA